MAKYTITETSGDEVAGMKNPGAGQIIELNDKQAEQPLRVGHIVPFEEAPAAPSKSAKE